MPAHRLWMKSGASGRAVDLDHTAINLSLIHISWCNKIFCGQTGRSQPVPFKLKWELFIHVEYRMKLGKPFLTVQCPGSYAKTLEVVEYIGLNTLQTGLGGFDAVSVNTKGQVFGLDETVVMK